MRMQDIAVLDISHLFQAHASYLTWFCTTSFFSENVCQGKKTTKQSLHNNWWKVKFWSSTDSYPDGPPNSMYQKETQDQNLSWEFLYCGSTEVIEAIL